MKIEVKKEPVKPTFVPFSVTFHIANEVEHALLLTTLNTSPANIVALFNSYIKNYFPLVTTEQVHQASWILGANMFEEVQRAQM